MSLIVSCPRSTEALRNSSSFAYQIACYALAHFHFLGRLVLAGDFSKHWVYTRGGRNRLGCWLDFLLCISLLCFFSLIRYGTPGDGSLDGLELSDCQCLGSSRCDGADLSSPLS